MVHQADGKSPPLLLIIAGTWTGAAIFQLTGDTRREMAMYTGSHYARTSARQVAKDQKKAFSKKVKKDKGGVNERLLGPQERALFKEAKVR